MTIEKSTLTVSSDKLPGTDMRDGTAASQTGGSNGSLKGYGENWGGNPWRAKGTEPEGKGDMWALDTDPTEKEPAQTISASDLMQGYADVTPERTPTFNRDDTGEEPVGDPFLYGGMLGRPRGTAR